MYVKKIQELQAPLSTFVPGKTLVSVLELIPR